MSDIITVSKPVRKSGFFIVKKKKVHVDMTPMVDLGFLLITFFIFTSALTEPGMMYLNMPNEKGPPTFIKQSGAITIIPARDNSIYYYEGDFSPAKMTRASLKELRDVLSDKQNKIAAGDIFVIIKPMHDSDYGTVVNVLDEMFITMTKAYAIVNITREEVDVINHGSGNQIE